VQPLEGRKMLIRILKDERGATAIEYGLIAALISLAMVIAFVDLGLSLTGIFDTISSTLRTANRR
jgi:pilus assembly protein Flp/PilA